MVNLVWWPRRRILRRTSTRVDMNLQIGSEHVFVNPISNLWRQCQERRCIQVLSIPVRISVSGLWMSFELITALPSQAGCPYLQRDLLAVASRSHDECASLTVACTLDVAAALVRNKDEVAWRYVASIAREGSVRPASGSEPTFCSHFSGTPQAQPWNVEMAWARSISLRFCDHALHFKDYLYGIAPALNSAPH